MCQRAKREENVGQLDIIHPPHDIQPYTNTSIYALICI